MEVSYRAAALILFGVIGIIVLSAIFHPIATLQAIQYDENAPKTIDNHYNIEEADIFQNSLLEAEELNYHSTLTTKKWSLNDPYVTNWEVKRDNRSTTKWVYYTTQGINGSKTLKKYEFGDPGRYYVAYVENRSGRQNDVIERGVGDPRHRTAHTLSKSTLSEHVDLTVVDKRETETFGEVYRLRVTESALLKDSSIATYANGFVDMSFHGDIIRAKLTVVTLTTDGVITERIEVKPDLDSAWGDDKYMNITEPPRFGEYSMNATFVDWNTMKVTNTGEKPWRSWYVAWKDTTQFEQTVSPGETIYLNARPENLSEEQFDLVVSNRDRDIHRNSTHVFDDKEDGVLNREEVDSEVVMIYPQRGWQLYDDYGQLPCKDIPVRNFSQEPFCPVKNPDSPPTLDEYADEKYGP